MHNIFKLLCLLILAVIIGSCINEKSDKSKNQESGNSLINPNKIIEFNIENPGAPEELRLSEFGIIDIEYIPLETNDNCLISRIRKFRTDGKNIIIYPSGGNIMKFTCDGKFVATIGKRGKGPQEYHIVHDIQIDPETENIYVLTGWEDKFYVYSPVGTFVKTIPAPEKVTNFDFHHGQMVCYCTNIDGNNEHGFIVTDLDGNIVKSYPNKYKYKRGKLGMGFVDEHFRYTLNKELLFKELFCDTVFAFDGSDFLPRYIINRGQKRLLPKSRTVNNQGESKKNMEGQMYEFNTFITRDFMYYFYAYNRELYYMIGTIQGGKTSVRISEEKLINDIDFGPKTDLKTTLDDTTILSWTSAVELIAHIASNEFKNSIPKYPEKKKALEQLGTKLNENDNPVLMLLKLK